MKTDIQTEENLIVARPEGRLDALSAPKFHESLQEAVPGSGHRVIIDMTGVPYVSSAGLRVFIQLAKQLKGQGKLALSGMSANVRQVFELAGFEKIMLICDDLAAARESI